MIKLTNAVPLAEQTPAPLLAAVGQLWQWGNWASRKALMCRQGAALGDVLVAVTDDAARQKVYFDVVYPGYVTDVAVDPTGNVIAYAIEYDAQDDDDDGASLYTYRREVDKASIRMYRNGEPYAYADQPASVPNPYGFVPAVWINHTATTSTRGQPALRNIGKVDEANALAAHALDQAHRILEAPLLIAGENISGAGVQQTSKGAATAQQQPPTASREEIKILTGAAGASIETARLDPGEALEHIDRILREIEADHPELTMYAKLREMSSISGPAADRLFGDVAALINDARAQYDQASIKLFQMGVAIAGWRANGNGWGSAGTLTRQQQAFLPYGLDSYAAGALDLSIQARPLILPSAEEMIAIETQAINRDRAKAGLAADQVFSANGSANGISARLQQASQTPQPEPA